MCSGHWYKEYSVQKNVELNVVVMCIKGSYILWLFNILLYVIFNK